MYGWKARIGVIVSPPNTVCEHEFERMSPPGVSTHVARMSRPPGVTSLSPEVLRQTNESLPQVAESLGHVKPDLIMFAHTMGSMIRGPEHEPELTNMLAEAAGCPALTTATSVVTAIKAMGLKKIAIATPYPEELTLMEKDYIEKSIPELQVVSHLSLGIESGFAIGDLEPSAAYRAARRVDHKDAEGLFLSGTNWRTIEVIEQLEKDLGKPVITANQATMWLALSILSIDGEEGYGSLFNCART